MPGDISFQYAKAASGGQQAEQGHQQPVDHVAVFVPGLSEHLLHIIVIPDEKVLIFGISSPA